MTDSPNTFIDRARSADLFDVGAAGYVAAVVVALSGREHLVLVHRASINDPAVVFDADCWEQRHEQTGALPPDWVRRINRCGRSTRTGQPCRNRVGRPGECCAWHRDAPQPDSRQRPTTTTSPQWDLFDQPADEAS